MLEALAKEITAQMVQYKVIQSQEQAVYGFGIRLFLTKVLYTVIFLLLGYCLNLFTECLLFISTYIFLRNYAGGYHASSHMKCFISSTWMVFLVLMALKFVPVNLALWLGWSLSAVAIGVILAYAPLGTSNKPLDFVERQVYRKKTKQRLLVITLAFVLCMVMQEVKYGFALSLSLFSESVLLGIEIIKSSWGFKGV